jgi:hypothetical protein
MSSAGLVTIANAPEDPGFRVASATIESRMSSS